MELNKAIELLRPAFAGKPKGRWADLGSGDGLFTNALSNLLADGSTIYAVDTNAKAIEEIQTNANIQLQKIHADFEKDNLDLKDLDGVLMANSFHFIKDKSPFIQKVRTWMNAAEKFIIVEYDTDKKTPWVPFPISFTSCNKLFSELGFTVKKIGDLPSIYNKGNMYAASFISGWKRTDSR